MGMAFDDFKTRAQGSFKDRVGQLAETPSGAGYQATLAQFAAGDKAARPRRPADLFPETEDFAGGDFDAINAAQGQTHIMHLAGGQRPLLRAGDIGPERRLRLGDRRRGDKAKATAMRMRERAGCEFDRLAPPSEADRP